MFALLRTISESAHSELVKLDLKSCVVGRYEFSDGIYMNVEEYVPQNRRQRRFESHRKYVDIQYIITGSEIITVADIYECEIYEEYDAVADIAFYKNTPVGVDYVLRDGEFVVLKPNEAHMPCIKVYGYENVKKAVVKIPVELYEKRKPETLQRIRFLVMDVDGTLTDGKIHMGNAGELFKSFNIKDGCGIHDILIPAGIEPIIITGRESQILAKRCEELGIFKLFQGVADKTLKLNELLNEVGGNFSDVAYIGDDINDISCIKRIKAGGGIIGCPADAVNSVREVADFKSSRNGGDGAVREFIEWLFAYIENRPVKSVK